MVHDMNQDDDVNQDALGQRTGPGGTNVGYPDQANAPGMLGAGGNLADVDSIEYTAPVGVPDVPGTAGSPGTISTAGAPGTPSMPKNTDVLGTAGIAGGHANRGNLEPGTPGVPGTPTPAPVGGQLASDKIPEAPGPQSPAPGDMGIGDTPTPGGTASQGDADTQPRYGASGTPGLGGARPASDDAGAGRERSEASGGADAQQAKQAAATPSGSRAAAPGSDEHVVSDEHGMRATDSAAGTGGSGIERLGGMPGGTPNYGGVGNPGGSSGLGTGRGPGPDSGAGGSGPAGMGTGGQVASGHERPSSTRVLPGGGTRPPGGTASGDRNDGTLGEDEALERARRAGEAAIDSGPSSTGGTLQRRPGEPRHVTPQLGGAMSSAGTSTSGDAPAREEDTTPVEHTEARPAGTDNVPGTGEGAAANNVARGGAEAATMARSGGGPTIAGVPAPNHAPPAPVTPDPYGGTASESHADPGFPPAVPEQPTPGLTREPGPEAQT